jgi:hypothetical protein
VIEINLDLLRFPDGKTVRVSAVDPEGAVAAPPGSLVLRSSGAIYRKNSGTGTTGWIDMSAIPITVMPNQRLRSSGWFNVLPGAGAPVAVGLNGTLSTTGTLSNGSDALHPYLHIAATTSILIGVKSNSASFLEVRHDPRLYFTMKTGSSILNVRFFIGLGPDFSSADTSGFDLVGFRYSTSAGDPGWVGICCDGTVAGNMQVSTWNVPIAASTRYALDITFSGGGTLATFSVNGVVAGTMTVRLPTGNVPITYKVQMQNLVAEAKHFDVGGFYAEWQ